MVIILYFIIACIFYCSQVDESKEDSYEPSLLSIFAISWPIVLLAIFINYLFKLFKNVYRRFNKRSHS